MTKTMHPLPRSDSDSRAERCAGLHRLGLIGALALLASPPASAGAIAVTDFNAYQSSVAGLPTQTVEGFDVATAPLTISDGGSYGDLTFTDLDLFGALPRISAVPLQTSSAPNALQTNLGQFVGGDGFALALANPVNAFGLFVITGDSLADADVQLDIGNLVVDLAADDVMSGARLWEEFDFATGTSARMYFLGAIADSPFDHITLTSNGGSAFSFRIDDVRYAVPLPATWLLLAPALCLPGRRRAARLKAR